MRRSLAALLVLVAFPSSAAAAPVLFLGHDGRASVRDDPFVNGSEPTPRPRSRPAGAIRASAARRGPAGRRRRSTAVTVRSVLSGLLRTRAITQTAFQTYSASFTSALAAEKRLTGTRRSELVAVTETLHQIAVSGALTPSRLPALFQTLDRNRQWWSTGPLPVSGQRVEFAGSQLVWEYYPGQGIQLQVLGSFGKADGLYTAGRAYFPRLRQLLAEIIPLAAQRGGGLTWEYYFNFDGGAPPWTSAMSQATGLEALTRAYKAFKDPYYLDVASRALGIFRTRPPVGVAVATPLGTRFLQYSFAPGRSIINAFMQTLIGLYDYHRVSRNPVAGQLFQAGNAEATAEVPAFDTGAWSLYQPGEEDPLAYHELVTGFLQELCARTATPVYCVTAQHFAAYLRTPPALQVLTGRVKLRQPALLRFRLSKYSHVGIVVTQGSRTVLATSADLPYGVDSFSLPGLRRPGRYTIRLAATDLAGNFARIAGALQVSRR